MANQTTDYHGDVYQWNRTVPTDERDTQTEYYLANWTDLVLAALFCMLIVVTIVSKSLMSFTIFLHLLSPSLLIFVSLFSTNVDKSSLSGKNSHLACDSILHIDEGKWPKNLNRWLIGDSV